LKRGTEVYGSRIRARVVKNKVAPPFRQAEFDLLHGRGISREASVLDVGAAQGIIKKSGAFFTYGDTKLGQGRDAAREFLEENTQVCDEIEARIREQGLNIQAGSREEESAEEE